MIYCFPVLRRIIHHAHRLRHVLHAKHLAGVVVASGGIVLVCVNVPPWLAVPPPVVVQAPPPGDWVPAMPPPWQPVVPIETPMGGANEHGRPGTHRDFAGAPGLLGVSGEDAGPTALLVNDIPEPGALAVMAVALVGLGVGRRVR